LLKQFLAENGFEFEEKSISDPDNRVDALMLGIYTLPGLVKGRNVLRAEDMFDGPELRKERVLRFLHEEEEAV
jgi:hypothetical protein